jgi:Ca2+-binding RTX toxin-like protein
MIRRNYRSTTPSARPWSAAWPTTARRDFMHGEAGDDIMFGMTGSDIMFGGAGDDDMIGGYGHDWMSGGTGQDGMLGDDGLIYTSRNSSDYGEDLYGVAAAGQRSAAEVLQRQRAQRDHLHAGQHPVLDHQHRAPSRRPDLTPFSVDPTWQGTDDEYPDSWHYPFADDIMFGGLGSDWIHGGSGDDAMSGAEALEAAFITVFDATGDGILDLGYDAVGLADGPWLFLNISTYGTQNPGDALAFNPVDVDGWKTQNRLRAGEFYYYDEYDPLRKIMLTDGGELHKGEPGQGTANDFLLNFNPTEGEVRPAGTSGGNKNQQVSFPAVNDDGDDVIFGGNGNDWLVGGTGRDHLYGGWGNDLLNVDDDHAPTAVERRARHPPDLRGHRLRRRRARRAHRQHRRRPADRLGGRVQQLPGAVRALRHGHRQPHLQPQLPEFLYALSLGDGIDPTRADDAAIPACISTRCATASRRRARPGAAEGLCLAGPDRRARRSAGGQHPGRQARRAADGLHGRLQHGGLHDRQRHWSVSKGKFQVAPLKIGGDAAGGLAPRPVPAELLRGHGDHQRRQAGGGLQGQCLHRVRLPERDNFKFAGVNQSNNKVEIGHKTANGWTVLTSINLQVRHSLDYNLLLSVNGTSVILVVNNQHQVSYTFAPRVDADGNLQNINSGMIGLGADNSKAGIGNVRLQVLPPQATFTATDDFSSAPALLEGLFGSWNLSGDGKLLAQPQSGAQLAIASGTLSVGPAHVLQLGTKLSTAATGGVVFDQYSADDFKWAAWSKETNQVQIGHYTAKGGWVVDRAVNMNLNGEVDLSVTLKGTTVSVLVNNSPAVSHVFNAVVTDGAFGVFTKGGAASFDHFTVLTDDPSFAAPVASNMTAAFAGNGIGVTPLAPEALDAVAEAAMNRWTFILGGTPAVFYGLEFVIEDLGGLVLARIEGSTITVDADAAGHGWFVDPTPYDDGEFRVRSADGMRANASSEAYGKIDLLTVLMHELGHAIGYQHDASVPGATALMAEDLVPGLRAVDFMPPGQRAAESLGDLAPTVGDPQANQNGKRNGQPTMAGAWSWDAERGAFVQEAGGWQNGRLFSYLSLAAVDTATQGDDWLAGDAAPAEAAAEDWLELAPASGQGNEDASLIDWLGF